MKKILTGITSTGKLTLGNYIGSIAQIKKMQEMHEDLYLFVADLHALSLPIDPMELEENIKTNIKIYLASGIDVNKCKLFIQSNIIGHSDLFLLLANLSYQGELNRMTQFKEKLSKITNKEKKLGVPLGLYVYPILMAADILLYNIRYVPVGEDQKQHVELTKSLIMRMNKKFDLDFNVPKFITTEVGSKIMALQDPTSKMSKSDKNKANSIFLLDDESEIRAKISKTKTDSENKVYYDVENKPGVSNLINIYSSLSDKTIKETSEIFENYSYKDFKDSVSDIIIKTLKPIQKNFETLDDAMIIEALNKNKNVIQKEADKNLNRIRKAMGIKKYE